jgi:putative transposase
MYAQYIHRLHRRLGHLWQSRFYSCPMDDAYADNATAYVELNPVRAGMVSSAWEYPWSSASAHCRSGPDASGLLDLAAWFEGMSTRRWKATLRAVADSDSATDRLRLHTRTGRPLGSDSFLSKVETYLGRRVRAVPRGRPQGSKDRFRRKRG